MLQYLALVLNMHLINWSLSSKTDFHYCTCSDEIYSLKFNDKIIGYDYHNIVDDNTIYRVTANTQP